MSQPTGPTGPNPPDAPATLPAILDPGGAFATLVEVMRRLLAPDGCPWDREQTLHTLRPYLLEETYEVLEALDHDDISGHRDELGDLLFQIVFQSALRQAQGAFAIQDVCAAIVAKMRRRHPHVFGVSGDETGKTQVSGSAEVLSNWRRIKEKELSAKGQVRRALDGVPRALPALLRAQRIGEKAAAVGFDWPDVQGVRDKVDEELRELDQAIAAAGPRGPATPPTSEIEHELGDLLMTVARLAAKLNVAPEDALRAALARFESRFAGVEDLASADGRQLRDLDLDGMEVYWQQVKRNQSEGGLPKK